MFLVLITLMVVATSQTVHSFNIHGIFVSDVSSCWFRLVPVLSNTQRLHMESFLKNSVFLIIASTVISHINEP